MEPSSASGGRLYLFFACQDCYPSGGIGDLWAEARHPTERAAREWADAMGSDVAGKMTQLVIVEYDGTRELDYDYSILDHRDRP